MDHEGLGRAIPPEVLITLDASVTLAYLAGFEAASPAAAWIFDGCVATGRNPAALSTLTAAELLVRPFRAGPGAVGSIEGFLHFFGIRLVDVTYAIAREAARVRAATGLAMPDAVVIATALESGAAFVATDDRGWPATLKAAAGDVTIVQIGAFVSSA